MINKVLLIGGSGNLGSHIVKSKYFLNIKYPSKKYLNILNKKKIEKYLLKNDFNLVLHCAAMARVTECEENRKKAKKINVDGTRNIVNSIIKTNKKKKKNIKLIFISSDAVYPSTKGNYKENDNLAPYNFYGKTKLEGEKIVKKLKNYIIIRTRFFDKSKISFKYSATNIYTSSLEVNILVKYLFKLIDIDFKGIINVGRKKISDYSNYKKFKKNLRPCDKSKIFNKLSFRIASDASMNISKLSKIL